MNKIISLFQRNYDGDRLVRNEVTPGAEWVVAGEGEATQKFDGTCCMVRDGKLFKRYDAKRGKTPPDGFEPSQDPDPVTGHWPGWLPVGDGPEDRWHLEAFADKALALCEGHTFELCGPKINGNPERMRGHRLLPHGYMSFSDCPRTFDQLKAWLAARNIEGIVWRHPDGRMVKIKKKDFGLPRETQSSSPGTTAA